MELCHLCLIDPSIEQDLTILLQNLHETSCLCLKDYVFYIKPSF